MARVDRWKPSSSFCRHLALFFSRERPHGGTWAERVTPLFPHSAHSSTPGAQSQKAALQGNLRSLSHQSPVKEAGEELLMAGSKRSRGGGTLRDPPPSPNTTPTASNPTIYPECNPKHSPSPAHQQPPSSTSSTVSAHKLGSSSGK